jgi:hypothetical protein
VHLLPNSALADWKIVLAFCFRAFALNFGNAAFFLSSPLFFISGFFLCIVL